LKVNNGDKNISNDKKVGETPVAGLQVPLGTHEIVFKNPQFPERRVTVTVTAKAGPPPTFLITAAPKAGTVMAGEAAFTLDQDGTKSPAGK
jgi:hypothetical protein